MGGRVVWGARRRRVGPRQASLPHSRTLTLAAIRSVHICLGQWEGGPGGAPSRTPGAIAGRRRARDTPPARTCSPSPLSHLSAEHLTSTAGPTQAPPLGSHWLQWDGSCWGCGAKAGLLGSLSRLSISASGAGAVGFGGWIGREPGELEEAWTRPGGPRAGRRRCRALAKAFSAGSRNLYALCLF